MMTVDDDFDLKRIADSGQCFRWEYVGGGEWRIIFRESCLYISRMQEGRFKLDCDDPEFKTVWRDYFDMDTDYRAIRKMIDPKTDPFLYAAAENEKGIRILRQDPWETTVSFIISQNRNIPAIRRSVEMLCRLAGEKHTDKKGAIYYSFPSPEAVLSMDSDDISKCRLGYRDKYVLAAARAACEGRFSPEKMGGLSDAELIRELSGLYGVGPKVASCIALFGFHRLDAFPVDVWIKRALEREYASGYPFDRYHPYNGVCQQYIFAYSRAIGAR